MLELYRHARVPTLQERAAVPAQSVGVAAFLHRGHELQRVHHHRGRDLDALPVRFDPALTELAAQLVEHLAERTARALGATVRPEEGCQLVAGRTKFEGEIEEEGKPDGLAGKLPDLLAAANDADTAEGGDVDGSHGTAGCTHTVPPGRGARPPSLGSTSCRGGRGRAPQQQSAPCWFVAPGTHSLSGPRGRRPSAHGAPFSVYRATFPIGILLAVERRRGTIQLGGDTMNSIPPHAFEEG
jgi:hypothetical protein